MSAPPTGDPVRAEVGDPDATVITGMGAWTALGRGVPAQWRAILEHRGGQAPAPELGSGGPTPWAARVPGASVHELGLATAREAWEDAGAPPLSRSILILGSAVGDVAARANARQGSPEEGARTLAASLPDGLARDLARALGVPHSLAVSNACTSSLQALILGHYLLQAGLVDRVLVGGAETVAPITVAGFTRLGAASPGPCCPFSEPRGMALGEGAGFLVLERAATAAGRGKAPRAWLLGVGMSSETWSPTAPEPRGRGMAASIQAALRDAGIAPSDVGFYDAQGTGTDANDQAEALAIRSVFGAVRVGAFKSWIGHTLGAAGALEAILTILALENGLAPGIHGFSQPRPVAPAGASRDAVPSSADTAVKHTSGFGGSNATVVVGLRPHRREATPRRGAVLSSAVVHAAPSPRFVDARRLTRDPAGSFLGSAVGEVLEHAEYEARRLGLVCGVAAWPGSADARFYQGIQDRSTSSGGVRAFSMMSRNAVAGSVCRQHGIEGPSVTLICGRAGGLKVLLAAAAMLAANPELEGVVACGLDEFEPPHPQLMGSPRGPAASAALLRPAGPGLALVGWGLGPPPPSSASRLFTDGQLTLPRAQALPGPLDGAAGPAMAAMAMGADSALLACQDCWLEVVAQG